MRGCSIAALLIALGALLLAPTAAVAKSWPIYDRDGHRAGSVRRAAPVLNRSHATVWQNTTMVRYCGEIRVAYTGEGAVPTDMWMVDKGDGSGFGGLVHKANRNRYDVYLRDAAFEYNRLIGRVARNSTGPWRVYKRVKGHFRRVGKVPRTCPGAFAAGGARLLVLLGSQGL